MEALLYCIPIIFLGILIFKKITLKNSQIFFTIGLILSLLLHMYMGVTLIIPLATAIIGEIIHLLSIGALGNKIYVKNSEALLYSIGLFPWLVSYKISLLYILLSIIFISLYKIIKMYKNAHNHSLNPIKEMFKTPVLHGGKLEQFLTGKRIFISGPLILSNIFAGMLFLIGI